MGWPGMQGEVRMQPLGCILTLVPRPGGPDLVTENLL